MNATINVASIVAIALSALPSSAQAWTQLAPAASPPPRWNHAMAHDSARQRLVLFGGFNGSPAALRDTWEWDGTNWLGTSPVSSPSARSGHAMAYAAAGNFTVLFGGSETGGSTVVGDTWLWTGTNWFAASPVNSPSARHDHAMAYDAARQRIVLFGGRFGGLGSGTAGDTWVWTGLTWTQLTPPASPTARFGHAMAYDEIRQRVVLFGGSGSSGQLGDTWEWDGTNWLVRSSSNHPSPRYEHAMAYDQLRQRVVLFGGYSSAFANLDDTWEWDGTNWVQLSPPAPLGRHEHAMAYHAASHRVVLFGGYPTPYETWVSAFPTTLASATAYGSGCGSPPLGFVPDTNGRPVLGQTASATIVDAPTPVAAVAVGFSNQFFGPFALPAPLAGIGMPGCDLWQSADVLGLGTAPLTPSTLSYSLAIPYAPSLIGLHLYLQAYALAPGVNPLQIIISNGIDWALGNV